MKKILFLHFNQFAKIMTLDNSMRNDIDQFIKSSEKKMVDKDDLQKKMVDKWSIKPSIARI